MCIPQSSPMLLTRNLLYTGITKDIFGFSLFMKSFLLLNDNTGRKHESLDLLCDKKDIAQIRELFRKNKKLTLLLIAPKLSVANNDK